MARVIKEYEIVSKLNIRDLSEAVAITLKKGWEPIGGISINNGGRNTVYIQAIVKYEDEELAIKRSEARDMAREVRKVLDKDNTSTFLRALGHKE